jgi:hypothetical protein
VVEMMGVIRWRLEKHGLGVRMWRMEMEMQVGPRNE